MRAFFILPLLFLFGCRNASDKSPAATTDTLVKKPTHARKFNPRDSISNLLKVCLTKDSFEYTGFYNENKPYELLYLKTGAIFDKANKHAVALCTINDTTVVCNLFSKTSGEWKRSDRSDTLKISSFSPAFFSTAFDDYNFDGMNDLKINFYTSMGQSYSYGYLLTFDPKTNCLFSHAETIEIPGMEINKTGKTIFSKEYSNPNINSAKYMVVSNYQWENNTLKLSSRKRASLKN